MIPVLSYEWFFGGDWSTRPIAFAAMMMITGLSALIALISFLFTQKYRHQLMKGS
jgi:putative spermidine/putrescine transport system permease protein